MWSEGERTNSTQTTRSQDWNKVSSAVRQLLYLCATVLPSSLIIYNLYESPDEGGRGKVSNVGNGMKIDESIVW